MEKLKFAVVTGLLLLSATAVSAPKQKIPYVVKDVPSADRCVPEDRNAPCFGRRITVHNPMRRTQEVVIECVSQKLRINTVIRRGRSVVVDLGSDKGSIPAGDCVVLSFWLWGAK